MNYQAMSRDDLFNEVVFMFGTVDTEAFASACQQWNPEQKSFCSLYLDKVEARKGDILARWKQRREESQS